MIQARFEQAQLFRQSGEVLFQPGVPLPQRLKFGPFLFVHTVGEIDCGKRDAEPDAGNPETQPGLAVVFITSLTKRFQRRTQSRIGPLVRPAQTKRSIGDVFIRGAVQRSLFTAPP